MRTYSEKAALAMSDARNRSKDREYTWHSSCGTFLVPCIDGEPQRVVDRKTGRNVAYLAKRWES